MTAETLPLSERPGFFASLDVRRELGMLVALFALCVVLWVSNSAFMGRSNVVNTTRQIGMLGILTLGIAFVIITGGIDLSIGSIVGLVGVVIGKISADARDGGMAYPLWIGIVVGLVVATLIGLAQGLLITRLRLQPFIVTLGGMLLLRGVSQTLVGGGNISVSSIPMGSTLYYDDLANGGLFSVGGLALLPYPMLIFIVCALIATYILHFTVFGRYVFAIGGNRDAAEYSGISVRNVEAGTYVISALTAGIAGVCYASYAGQVSQQVGVAYELQAIAAAVLGGCSLRGGEGTVLGVLIGTSLLRIIDNGIDMFQIPSTDEKGNPGHWKPNTHWRFIIIGAVILIAVILDQVVHIMQQRRRTKMVAAAHAAAGEKPG